jgi:hypothetical protein
MPGFSALTAVAIDQTAATDRDQQQGGLRRVLEDLQADRALAGDHRGIGEGVDVAQAFALGGGQRRVVGLVPDTALDADLRVPGLELRGLGLRRAVRQVDDGAGPGLSGGIGDRQAVVAARGGDDAAADVRVVEAEQLVGGAARLERARDLQALQLEPKLARCRRVLKRRGADQRRAADPPRDAPGRGLDVGELHRCAVIRGHPRPASSSHASSERTVTPSSAALRAFDPASAPTTT